MKKIYFILLVLLVAGGQIIAQQNVIENSDFEGGATDGWTLDTGSDGAAAFWVVDDPKGVNGKVLKVEVTQKVTDASSKDQFVKIVSSNVTFTDGISAALGDTVRFFMKYDFYKEGSDGSKNSNWSLSYAEECTATNGVAFAQLAAKASSEWVTKENNAKYLIRNTSGDNSNPVVHLEMALQDGVYYFDNFDITIDKGEPSSISSKLASVKMWSFNNTIIVNNDSGKSGEMSIYDMSGRELSRQTLNKNENIVKLNSVDLCIVRINIDGEVISKKMVLK